MTPLWSGDDESELILYVEQEDKSKRRDSLHSELQYILTPQKWQGFEFGAQYAYTTQTTQSVGTIWMSKWGKSYQDRLLWELQWQLDHDFRNHVIHQEIEGTLSWSFDEHFSLDTQWSYQFEEGHDRDQVLNAEVSINYDF